MKTISQKDLRTLAKSGKVDRKDYKAVRVRKELPVPEKPDPVAVLAAQVAANTAAAEKTLAPLLSSMTKVLAKLAEDKPVIVKTEDKKKRWKVKVSRGKDKLITGMEVQSL